MVAQKEDTSRKILFILLIVIIFISILGTWTLLLALDSIDDVGLAITDKGTSAATTGQVTFEILERTPTEERRDGDNG